MGCSGSKPLPPPTAATQPAAVSPAGVLKASTYDGTVAEAAAAPPPVPQDQKVRVSFKAAIQKQLAVQAFEQAGETYRHGQVCRTQQCL